MWWLLAKYIPFGAAGRFVFWAVAIVAVIHMMGGL